jgi:hypothetical protein
LGVRINAGKWDGSGKSTRTSRKRFVANILDCTPRDSSDAFVQRERCAGLETCDTAGLETCATSPRIGRRGRNRNPQSNALIQSKIQNPKSKSL